MNVIRLFDLWECVVTNSNKLEKKYIWKRIKPNGENPLPRNGHTMVYYRNNLIIYGGVIEENRGIRVKEDLLCYDIIFLEVIKMMSPSSMYFLYLLESLSWPLGI